jgi:hypothetical protein
VRSGLGDWLAASCPESATDGEVGIPAAPVEALVCSGHGCFDVFVKVFPIDGLGGLSTIGDSLSGARFFVGEAKRIS